MMHARSEKPWPLAARVAAAAMALGTVLFEVPVAAPQSKQSDMFSGAEKYERFMGRWSRRLAPEFAKFAGVQDGDRVLDVGSGTGSLSFAIGAQNRRSEVVGIDPSQAFVDFAKQRASDNRTRFQVGDAQRIEFPDASFDRSLALLVINFIPDAGKAAREMRRVTKPGGWIAACVWDYDQGMTMLRLFWDAVLELDPGAIVDERNMRFCRQGELATLWRDAGLEDVQETQLVVDMNFSSFEDYWSPFLEGQGPAGSYTVSLSPERRDALKARLKSKFLAGRPDGPTSLKARAWAVRGRVPGGKD